jgi:mono/diheme cytochrome c family protein
MNIKRLWLYFIFFIFAFTSYAQEPQFTIKSEKNIQTYSLSELLNGKNTQSIVLDEDPTYPEKKITYRAIPLYKLFERFQVSKDSVLQFYCADGFSAPISSERILNHIPSLSIAYLAIEPPQEKWPFLKKDPSKTAGPFKVIWTHPKASKIGQEEWPYQVVRFEIKKSLESLYPAIFPDRSLSENHPIWRGFKIFTKNCFSCHTLNHQGAGIIGPDLNLPLNPTEYFLPPALKQLIRNPKKVRNWPDQKMPEFSQETISDPELEDLVSYLKHMAKRRSK